MSTTGEQYAPIFGAGSDWQFNACIGWSHDRYYVYGIGYKQAADQLVEIVKSDRTLLDTTIYPIAFLYRQYVELSLKQLIIMSHGVLSIAATFPMVHVLPDLWNKLIALVSQYPSGFEMIDQTAMNAMERVVVDFDLYDSNSMDFRYPVDRNMQKTLANLSTINIEELRAAMEAYEASFDSWSMAFDQYTEYLSNMAGNIGV